jgi:hypothetical protein
VAPLLHTHAHMHLTKCVVFPTATELVMPTANDQNAPENRNVTFGAHHCGDAQQGMHRSPACCQATAISVLSKLISTQPHQCQMIGLPRDVEMSIKLLLLLC